MNTKFYKILNKKGEVIYVGVTTRSINERFKEHIISKGLNWTEYNVLEFDKIEHRPITSIEEFYTEREKVVNLEQKYIKEELSRGSNLINISNGGEWGSQILNQLRKEKFFQKFNSYEGYVDFKNRNLHLYKWLKNWYNVKVIMNKTRNWMSCWIRKFTENKSKIWIKNWIKDRAKNYTKIWIKNWRTNRSQSTLKVWLKRWVESLSKSRVRRWLSTWKKCRTTKKVYTWLNSWKMNKNFSKSKRWLQRWLRKRKAYLIRGWMYHWISHRKYRAKEWMQRWIFKNMHNHVKKWMFHWVEVRIKYNRRIN